MRQEPIAMLHMGKPPEGEFLATSGNIEIARGSIREGALGTILK